MTDKQTLRAQMRAMRKGLSADVQRHASEAVCRKVLSLAPYKKANCVMAYIACRGELDVLPVIANVLAGGKTLVLPRCEKDGSMTARSVWSLSSLLPGAYGILEPGEQSEIVPPPEIDFILVPGTAFDRDCCRLGQGGGYYDKFLRETSAFCAGVCHEAALVEYVPREAHDLPMDAVITPEAMILRGGSQI